MSGPEGPSPDLGMRRLGIRIRGIVRRSQARPPWSHVCGAPSDGYRVLRPMPDAGNLCTHPTWAVS
jgi:hypothetical protein